MQTYRPWPATYTQFALNDPVTLSSDLLTSGSMHVERLQRADLMLHGGAVFLLYRGQTDRQTDATDRPAHGHDGYRHRG